MVRMWIPRCKGRCYETRLLMILRPLLLIFLASPLLAMDQQIDCSEGGTTTYEISVCKDRTLDGLKYRLSARLTTQEIEDLDQATLRVCSVAKEPRKQVTIYPLMVRSCMERIFRVALDEMAPVPVLGDGIKGTDDCF